MGPRHPGSIHAIDSYDPDLGPHLEPAGRGSTPHRLLGRGVRGAAPPAHRGRSERHHCHPRRTGPRRRRVQPGAGDERGRRREGGRPQGVPGAGRPPAGKARPAGGHRPRRLRRCTHPRWSRPDAGPGGEPRRRPGAGHPAARREQGGRRSLPRPGELLLRRQPGRQLAVQGTQAHRVHRRGGDPDRSRRQRPLAVGGAAPWGRRRVHVRSGLGVVRGGRRQPGHRSEPRVRRGGGQGHPEGSWPTAPERPAPAAKRTRRLTALFCREPGSRVGVTSGTRCCRRSCAGKRSSWCACSWWWCPT